MSAYRPDIEGRTFYDAVETLAEGLPPQRRYLAGLVDGVALGAALLLLVLLLGGQM